MKALAALPTFHTSSTSASSVATLTLHPYRSPNTRIRGPAISITTLPPERVLGEARVITSTRTLAASSFSSGDPLIRPSFSSVSAGVIPWGSHDQHVSPDIDGHMTSTGRRG